MHYWIPQWDLASDWFSKQEFAKALKWNLDEF